jgi:hypothetical protein
VASECGVIDVVYAEDLIEEHFDAVKDLSGSHGRGGGG